MNSLVKLLIAFVPASVLLVASVITFTETKRLSSLLQLIGAAGVLTVVLVHLCEELQIFPRMHWGRADRSGHYLDLIAAIVSITLFPLGLLLSAMELRH